MENQFFDGVIKFFLWLSRLIGILPVADGKIATKFSVFCTVIHMIWSAWETIISNLLKTRDSKTVVYWFYVGVAYSLGNKFDV